MNIKELALRMFHLQQEVELIQSKIKPQDCGHLKTTVSVLKERINEIKMQIERSTETLS